MSSAWRCYERIANGLGMPDDARHLLGLAASRELRRGGQVFDLAAFPEVVDADSLFQDTRPHGLGW
ncbi:hypothetical protein [Streptomyces sp. NBC_01262]|uniref:hypothetical protein n=1 Tax=Streptomyces sp. NBC_01262 TaxID=2903803 RepID=UPI002E378FA4|nr:hypothetical protein [Streptomyces sp. NBC_01262]